MEKETKNKESKNTMSYMNEKKESFIIRYSSIPQINALDQAQKGDLLDAVIKYSMNGIVPDNLNPVTNNVFLGIQYYMDIDERKYKETSEKNSKNGAKGGRPKSKAAANTTGESKAAADITEKPKAADTTEKPKAVDPPQKNVITTTSSLALTIKETNQLNNLGYNDDEIQAAIAELEKECEFDPTRTKNIEDDLYSYVLGKLQS